MHVCCNLVLTFKTKVVHTYSEYLRCIRVLLRRGWSDMATLIDLSYLPDTSYAQRV